MHGRAAEIAKLLGRLSDADAYCRESTRLYEQTSHEFPSDHDSLQMLARFLALRAEINLQQRNAAGAVEAAGQAASIRGYLTSSP
jgi:hypothetical protein